MSKPFEFTYKTMQTWQILLILSFAWFLFIGTWQEWLIAFAIYYVRSIIGTVILHRYLSHRSFKMHKWMEYFLTFITVMGGNASAIVWIATHRQHHRYSDRPDDPHSPLSSSVFQIYTRTTGKHVSIGYAADLVRSKFHRWCHQWHWAICIAATVLIYFIDPRAIFYAWMVPNFFGWLNGSSVNGLNHLKIGYRNFETKDQSNNFWVTGYLCAGEGWHNNHHSDPANPNFRKKWWEFDPGYLLVKLIRTDK